MTASRDPDRLIHHFLLEGEERLQDQVYDAVRAEIEHRRQRVVIGPWRLPEMTKIVTTAIGAAAAVVVVAIAGYQFLPGGSGSGGANATPSPSPALLARGDFVVPASGAVELEATGGGSSVTGRMTVSAAGGDAFTVDLRCTRTTEDGLIMIGGVTTDSTAQYVSPEGTWAGIVLQRGSPAEASIWSQRGGPTSEAASCLAYLDEQLMWDLRTHPGGDWLDPIEGTVELGVGTGLPEGGTCAVTVVNHLLPVEAGGAPEQVILEPPYVAEMGWRYGGADRRPLADVRIFGEGWGDAAVHFELVGPNGEPRHSGNILRDEFRPGGVGLSQSLSTVGTWQYHLRGLDDEVECQRTVAIEVVPDSKRRAIDP